ncbi:MAG: protein-glutamate O-methyltransferase CheR [Chitinivibrionales bacterium]|nr:protein-glutamate O-methyltransferase CheR [Chitinivibrionales bacterium]
MEITAQEFRLFKDLLLSHSGIEVGEDKSYLFTTRLKDLVECEGCKSFLDLYDKITSGRHENLSQIMVELMTTHESGFFRDAHPFKTFFEVLLPALAESKLAAAHFLPPRLRILSAGCCFGQEPYSIAIGIRRWLAGQGAFRPENIAILGIDISGKALERAQKGVFSDLELGKNLSEAERKAHFVKYGDQWRLADEIKKMVSFERRSLTKALDGLGPFDVIFCRNVIIYFSPEMKKQALRKIGLALEPQGLLFLGVTENMYKISDDYSSHTIGETTYYKVLKHDTAYTMKN